ncbi:disulfide bond corrector protein DsbC [Arcticibacter tournemirensis]|uniref:Sugar transporter n=1 Tax=Arcticibacter tournemirensis TaxID=699437 RepID=A0A4Q0MA37_9SPHI|nr:protein-disulfide reductase DsbD domain-containing protein [Arcticibacter tournemirensis]KAA8485326.1 sugar transporter [Arcticibacter tournemirensis]RXF70024.1 sugar transporter [Arcticibacter tournemirensis]TQM50389.1 disulfide bond corrector protein DsbC [Arcticibacter tournemirensis]
MRKIVLFVLVGLLSSTLHAQILKPVKWSYAAKRVSKTEAVVLIKATIENGWHIYSQHVGEGGPIPTSFTFSPSKTYTVQGKTIEPKPVSKFEKTFNMNVSYFEKSVVFQQRVKLNAAQAAVKGKLEFMACDDHQCLPPEEVEFSIPVK